MSLAERAFVKWRNRYGDAARATEALINRAKRLGMKVEEEEKKFEQALAQLEDNLCDCDDIDREIMPDDLADELMKGIFIPLANRMRAERG